MGIKSPCAGSDQAVAGSNPVGPVLFFALLLFSQDAHCGLLVSNASVGGTIYVFYEGELLQNESILVMPPFGKQFEMSLEGNAAQFNATRQGRWEIVFRGKGYAAFVSKDAAGSANAVQNAPQIDSRLLFASIAFLFACAFLFVFFAWNARQKKEIGFYAQGGGVALKSRVALEEVRIEDARGRVLWRAGKFDREGELVIKLSAMQAPFYLHCIAEGREIRICSNGEAGAAGLEKAGAGKKSGWKAGGAKMPLAQLAHAQEENAEKGQSGMPTKGIGEKEEKGRQGKGIGMGGGGKVKKRLARIA